ncbi:BREX-1 system adenine-specific DNA-methyltransferase PglX [Hornefia butyriciproducens]|uniref:BREX-1 system adenine-specific DNA-methyltransferase PglX n=1 Tax=Hornefia butyriciproducens TaxID=2652293 RepID=UPI003F8CE766
MDKNAIKKYAVWARNELIARVTQKAEQYEITEQKITEADADRIGGRVLTATEKKQRQALIAKINLDGFGQVMEEVAYTWFNRFTALRFMEVNNYLPSHTRVFTNEAGEFKPQILADAIQLDLEGLDMDKVFELKDANKTEELYKYLLITQCNTLSEILPGMFQKIEDYTELLLPDYLLRDGSIVEQMVSSIKEEDWTDQVQIIGWLYQYYISEPKDKLINAKKQYGSNDIPFVTQIFTSDWIVKYMVQNSLGRLWMSAKDKNLSDYGWEYYLNTDIKTKINSIDPKDLRIIDPCMGSGHIIAYVFDVLIQLYESYGYTQREASELILEYNIYGMDISDRAYQLAYFSIMMKARQYNRTILKKKIKPHLFYLENVAGFDRDLIEFITEGDAELVATLKYVAETSKNLGLYGSLIKTEHLGYQRLLDRIEEIRNAYFDDLIRQSYQKRVEEVKNAVLICDTLCRQFDCVITNPPYIGNRLLPTDMRSFIEKNYKEYKSDIFSAFVARILEMCKSHGHIGMLTPYVWMFISTYEELRNLVLNNAEITSLVQLEYNAFEAACVPVCSFTLRKEVGIKNAGEYVRLSEFRGPDIQGIKVKEAVLNPDCGFRYETNQNEYGLIPGTPVAYWVDEKVIDCFKKGERVDAFAYPKQGLATADNNRFLRLWHEVDINRVGFDFSSGEVAAESSYKWFPYNKGGGYKKWYGNNEYVINWQNDGAELRNFKGSVIRSPQYYFRKGISWCKITSSNFSMRYIPEGFLFDVAGCTLFASDDDLLYLLGFMNSSINSYILALISPTLNYEVGHVGSLPIIRSEKHKSEVETIVSECIALCKNDWDSYEMSWDFLKSPLVNGKGLLEEIYSAYTERKKQDFRKLKKNEERLNEIFANIYGVEGVVETSVLDEDVIIGQADYCRDMKNLISYSVGCMFGRYSLDRDGIVFAGGTWDSSKYITFTPDKDAIIPICDDEYFEDDIVGRFVKFMRIAFGEEDLENNLAFVARALKYEGTSRQILRQYFINDFYDDHCNVYTSRGAGKRPIYWLFDSGKKNGFKCLVYMHRYRPDTIARIRTDYVHEQQSRYRTAIADLENRINGAGTSERVKLNKQLSSLQAQATEIREYEEKIHHLADQMISIDLDDGVKHNYEIFKDVLAKIK